MSYICIVWRDHLRNIRICNGYFKTPLFIWSLSWCWYICLWANPLYWYLPWMSFYSHWKQNMDIYLWPPCQYHVILFENTVMLSIIIWIMHSLHCPLCVPNKKESGDNKVSYSIFAFNTFSAFLLLAFCIWRQTFRFEGRCCSGITKTLIW